MQNDLEQTLALLKRTPNALTALLQGWPETWTMRNEGEGTWTPFDIVAHLIHCEHDDWIPRARCILEHGEKQAFAPFDREGNFKESRRKSLDELLEEFANARRQSLQQLGAMNLQAKDLEKTGKHPALGTVTLCELLATWAAHDLTHLHQLARVMAAQYQETVGPFRKYLGVMHCTGHGA